MFDLCQQPHVGQKQQELLFFLIAGTNDASGTLDEDAISRCRHTHQLYQRAITAGQSARIIPSGDIDRDGTAFNPTNTSHWQYITRQLVSFGVPPTAIITPGVPALHTVHEAIMAHDYVAKEVASRSLLEVVVVVVVSAFHFNRVKHLFSVAFQSSHITRVTPHIHLRFETVANTVSGEWLETRLLHENSAIKKLRTNPTGLWKDFITANNLEAPNRDP
jgi:uncharacterized SAM-binding protein YcdF (DUF218 family)